MTASDSSDDRVLFEIDPEKRIATITLNNPKRRNSYDASMREAVARCLDYVADDDDLTVVLLRGADGVFSTGADMNNAYGWYGEQSPEQPGDSETRLAKSRPSQRRRLTSLRCGTATANRHPWRTRPGVRHCVITSACSTPSPTAMPPGQYGWHKTT